MRWRLLTKGTGGDLQTAMEVQDDQPQRDQHLDLLAAELKELRETVQSLAMLQMADGGGERLHLCVRRARSSLPSIEAAIPSSAS